MSVARDHLCRRRLHIECERTAYVGLDVRWGVGVRADGTRDLAVRHAVHRVDEALAFYGRVNPDNVQTKLQYDYLSAYVDLYTGNTAAARIVASKYKSHPVDRWRKAFTAVLAQLDEIEGAEVQLVDTENRTNTQTKLAASDGGFNFKVESKQVKLNYQNLDRVQVNYYLMDVELLFSRNPFVQQHSGQFAYIRPNATATIKLPKDKVTMTFALPEQLHNANVLVEIVGDRKSVV